MLKLKTERIDAASPNGIGGWPPIYTWIIPPSLGRNGPHCVEILHEMRKIMLNWVLDLSNMSWTCRWTCWMRLVILVSLSTLDSTCVDFVYVFAWGMATSGSHASGARLMECLSWWCRGTSMSEEKMSSYSSMTLSICYSHAREPCFEVFATIFFFPYEQVVRKINFLVWETILLRCFTVVKEMIGGGTTSGIL